jgi:hypothetical protein
MFANFRKDVYDKDADYYIETGGGKTLEYLYVAESVARQLGLAIATCDRRTMLQSIQSRAFLQKENVKYGVQLRRRYRRCWAAYGGGCERRRCGAEEQWKIGQMNFR